jgi:DNA-binding NarL/FixJ family response regulator
MKVLIVEDSPEVRKAIKLHLADIPGCEVVGEAEDPSAAIHLIALCTPDAVLLDLGLRHGNGLQVLEALRVQPLHPLVIVLTNHTEPHYVEAALRLGAAYVFQKSSGFEAALELLRRMAVPVADGGGEDGRDVRTMG